MPKETKILVVDSLKIGNKGDDLMCKRPVDRQSFTCIRRVNAGNDLDMKSGIIDGVDNVTAGGLGVTTVFKGDNDSMNIIVVPAGEPMDCAAEKNGQFGTRDLTCRNMDVKKK
jgi:hypothetical protein